MYNPSVRSGIPFLAVRCCGGHCIARKKHEHRLERHKVPYAVNPIESYRNCHTSQGLTRVYISRIRSEMGYGKSYILVWNRARVFWTGRHTSTQKYYEYPHLHTGWSQQFYALIGHECNWCSRISSHGDWGNVPSPLAGGSRASCGIWPFSPSWHNTWVWKKLCRSSDFLCRTVLLPLLERRSVNSIQICRICLCLLHMQWKGINMTARPGQGGASRPWSVIPFGGI